MKDSQMKLLRMLSNEGLLKKSIQEEAHRYNSVCSYELSCIEKMCYEDYMLMAMDIVDYAKEHGIVVGTGRGAVCASLVAYCIGLTEVDPVKYNLVFARFMNSSGKTLPEIDVDIDPSRIDEVIAYAESKYSSEMLRYINIIGNNNIVGMKETRNVEYNMEELIAKIAMNRPGTEQFKAQYEKNKMNIADIQYVCPQLKLILESTYGCIIYQEQIIHILHELGGYEYEQCTLIWNQMRKGRVNRLQKEKDCFINGGKGAVSIEISEDTASQIFDDMEERAKYTFHKAHAAGLAEIYARTH